MKKKSTTSNRPVVGDGVTIHGWSDRTPGTIIQVSASGHRIVVQEDNAIRLDNNGMSESQEYRYERDPNGPIHIVTRRKNGSYRVAGGNSGKAG